MEQKMHKTNPELHRRRTAFVGRRASLRGYFPQVEEKSVLSALSSCRRRVGEKFQLLGRLSLGTQRFSRQRG